MLKLLAPGERVRSGRPNKFYYARGTVSGQEFEFSTKTTDLDRARRIVELFEKAIAEETVRSHTSFSRRGASATVLSLEDIYALPTAGICGLYFLILKGQVQYIGQSSRIPYRLRRHREEQRILFSGVRVLACTVAELDFLEAAYIAVYKPPFNRGLNRNRRLKPPGKTVGTEITSADD